MFALKRGVNVKASHIHTLKGCGTLKVFRVHVNAFSGMNRGD